MTVKLGTFGPLPRETQGQAVTIRVTLGYSGTRYVDLIVGGTAIPVPNDHLRASVVPDPSPLAGRAIALVRRMAEYTPAKQSWRDEARAIIEELDA